MSKTLRAESDDEARLPPSLIDVRVAVAVALTTVLAALCACGNRSVPSAPVAAITDAGADAAPPVDATLAETDCAAICQWSRCPGVSDHESCMRECRATYDVMGAQAGCLPVMKTRAACLDQLDCQGMRAHFDVIRTGNGTSTCLRQEKLTRLYCLGRPELAACLNNCSTDRRCGLEVRELDDCAVACLDGLNDTAIQHGLECLTATSIYSMCLSTLNCDQRRALRDRVGEPPCRAEAKEVGRRCGITNP